MTRTEYDVAEPGTPRDAATDPPAHARTCPYCGSGPCVWVTGLGLTCKSCARVVVAGTPATRGSRVEGDAP